MAEIQTAPRSLPNGDGVVHRLPMEVKVEPKRPQLIRTGYLKTLSADYVGERHVVIGKREPSGATGQDEWCEFEERPGSAEYLAD